MLEEPSLASKLLELLTEIAPSVKRAAFMINPDMAPYVESFYLPVFEAAARTLKVAPIIGRVHNDAEIEKLVASLGREPRGGLIGASDRFIHPDATTSYRWRADTVYRGLCSPPCERRRFAGLTDPIIPVNFTAQQLASIASCAARSRPDLPVPNFAGEFVMEI
jgi:hypothetical protein